MSEDGQLPALPPPQEMAAKDYAPSIRVVGPDGRKWDVAVSAAANRNHWQIVISKLSRLLERSVDRFTKDEGEIPDVLTISRLTQVAETLQSMSTSAYGTGKALGDGHGEMERFATGVIRAAAEGMVRGNGRLSELEHKMRMLASKKAKPAPDTVDGDIIDSPPDGPAQATG